jgi:MYXO-CTERM domain-containing protein
MQLKNRLDAHFASAAAVAVGVAVLGAAPQADAAVVWSGVVNINIPSTVDGVYLNVVTGEFGTSGSGVSGWDVNPYGTSSMGFYGNTSGGYMRSAGSSATLVDNLAFLTVIGPSQTFGSGTAGVESTGSTAMNLNSSENLVGFRFLNEATGQVHYGWMRIQFTGTSFSQPRAIVEFAYESTAGASIQAGVIPAPGALALLGAAGLLARRRRR